MSTRFDLRQLRYFVVVAEELNFRRAAERLFISQPPLSRAIRELETGLNATLLARDTTGVTLTAAGRATLKRARKLLADADALADEAGAWKAQASHLRIAASIAIPVSKQKKLADAWRKTLGADSVDVVWGESKKLQPRVRQGQFDFALLGGPGDFRGLESAVIQTLPLVVILPPAHPAAKKRTVGIRDMQGTPLFWFPRNYNPSYFDFTRRAFAELSFTPEFIYVAPGQLTTMERIGQGDGFSLVTVAQAEMKIDGVAVRPLKEGARLGISLVAAWPARDAAHAALAKKFLAASRKVIAA